MVQTNATKVFSLLMNFAKFHDDTLSSLHFRKFEIERWKWLNIIFAHNNLHFALENYQNAEGAMFNNVVLVEDS